MIRESVGKISEELYVLGNPALPAYLLKGEKPVLFDAGMTFMGPFYLKELREHLGDPHRLAYNFLTHSHYDHCGSAPFLKRSLPGMKVAASRMAGEVFQRPNAIRLIQSLSREMEERLKPQIGEGEVSFRGLDLDLALEDGQEIELEDGVKIQVIATPGHTRDSVSYYIPRRKVLVAGEAVGGFDRNFHLHPVFLSSYEDYLSSLKKLEKLKIDILLMGHLHVWVGDARRIIAQAIEATRAFGRRIERELDLTGGDQEAVVKKIFQEDYVEKRLIRQEERPFLINLTAQVKAVAKRKSSESS